MTIAVPFPDRQPAGYDWLDDEEPFRPERHLAIEDPTGVTTLAELGYDPADIEPTATEIAFSTPFRVLSDEGSQILLDIARRLRPFTKRAGDRIENVVRGGCYRSRWLRDLCLDPEVTAAMSAVYGTPIAPHTMPVHLGHLNYEPSVIEHAVDKWHHDTIPLDYVMMVTDPESMDGGRFEIFRGTRAEAATLAADGRRPPTKKIEAPHFPGPGWAIALHGNMVVHRGAPLNETAERITMVNAYVALDRTTDDQSRSRDLIGIDDPASLYTEWARHAAWRASGRLEKLVASTGFDDDPASVAADLEHAIADVTRAIDDMRAGAKPADHYER